MIQCERAISLLHSSRFLCLPVTANRGCNKRKKEKDEERDDPHAGERRARLWVRLLLFGMMRHGTTNPPLCGTTAFVAASKACSLSLSRVVFLLLLLCSLHSSTASTVTPDGGKPPPSNWIPPEGERLHTTDEMRPVAVAESARCSWATRCSAEPRTRRICTSIQGPPNGAFRR